MKFKLSLICFVAFSSVLCPYFGMCSNGGEDSGDKGGKKKKAADKGIDLLFPRARFFQLTYRNYPFASARQNGESDANEEGKGHVVKTKLLFPLMLSSEFKLIGQVGYQREWVNIPESAGGFGNVDFQKVNFALIGEKKLKNDKFLLGILSTASKSEKTSFKNIPAPNSLSATVMVGKEFGAYNKLGFGVSTGVEMGRLRVSPILAINKKIDQRNFIDALLPKSITYRHLMSNKFYFYTSVEADKFNYQLSDDKTFMGSSDLELRRTEVSLNFGLEREIHDWLWMSFNMGLTKPVRNIILEQGDRSRNDLSTFNDHIQPIVSVSLFAVIPQKLAQKFARR